MKTAGAGEARKGARSGYALIAWMAVVSGLFALRTWAQTPPASSAVSAAVPAAVQPGMVTGPPVGAKIPAFQARDQNGKLQDFNSLKGPKGLALYFNRSVDWCPYCKTQLIELQQYADAFRRQGFGVAVITYDSAAILADFAKRKNITVSMLSDSQSKIIRDFGILNTSVARGDMMYGIPYPGTYIVDASGIVKAKYFEDQYQDRYSAPSILLREFGSVAGTRQTEVQSKYLSVKYYATRDVVHPDLRFTLVADVALPPTMHVYSPDVKGYIPIQLQIASSPNFTAHPAEYPKPDLLMLPVIQEVVPVYQNQFRITQDITMAEDKVLQPLIAANGTVQVNGTLRYQACDDKVCYLPQTVPLEWTLKVEPLERDRVPEAIQHKAPPPSSR